MRETVKESSKIKPRLIIEPHEKILNPRFLPYIGFKAKYPSHATVL
jgi:hypothetical protein